MHASPEMPKEGLIDRKIQKMAMHARASAEPEKVLEEVAPKLPKLYRCGRVKPNGRQCQKQVRVQGKTCEFCVLAAQELANAPPAAGAVESASGKTDALPASGAVEAATVSANAPPAAGAVESASGKTDVLPASGAVEAATDSKRRRKSQYTCGASTSSRGRPCNNPVACEGDRCAKHRF